MDHHTIRQLRNGDEKARSEFYKQYRIKLYHYCFQLLGNRSDAEDAVHETFVRIFNGINGLQSSDAFRSWIYTIARNESLQLLRKKRPVVLMNKEEVSDGETIQTQIDSQELAQYIRDEVDALKNEYREIILLREYHHLSYEEIARVLEVSESTVKNRLFRARKKLYEKLKPLFDEGK